MLENHDKSTDDPIHMHIIESFDNMIITEKSLFGKTGFNSIKFNHALRLFSKMVRKDEYKRLF